MILWILILQRGPVESILIAVLLYMHDIYFMSYKYVNIFDIVSTKKLYDMWHDNRYNQFITFSLEVYGKVGHLCIRDCVKEY